MTRKKVTKRSYSLGGKQLRQFEGLREGLWAMFGEKYEAMRRRNAKKESHQA